MTIWLDLRTWHIIVLQAVIVMLAASQVVAKLIAKRRGRDRAAAEQVPGARPIESA